MGRHRDLLAYLVRLLESGANSSFVARVGGKKVPVRELLERPAESLRRAGEPRHPGIVRPHRIHGQRKNSAGVEFGAREELGALVAAIAAELPLEGSAGSIIDGHQAKGGESSVSPVDGAAIGRLRNANADEAAAAMDARRGARGPGRDGRRGPRPRAGSSGRPDGGPARPHRCNPRTRGRQDARRRHRRNPRSGGFPALLRSGDG